MPMRFRKTIKVAPGIKLNFSKSGVSTTIGKRGASVNIGPRGTHVNVGIPGSGISYRGKVGASRSDYRAAPVRPYGWKSPTWAAIRWGILTWIGMAFVIAIAFHGQQPPGGIAVPLMALIVGVASGAYFSGRARRYNEALPLMQQDQTVAQREEWMEPTVVMCFCQACGKQISSHAETCPDCGHPNSLAAPKPVYAQVLVTRGTKSKMVAGVLALFLGGIGAHKFYLGKPFWGLAYLVFCFTFIPAILGLIEAIAYFASSDESFARKYG